MTVNVKTLKTEVNAKYQKDHFVLSVQIDPNSKDKNGWYRATSFCLVMDGSYPECPACDSEDFINESPYLKVCKACGAHFGSFPSFEETTKIVRSEWHRGEIAPPEDNRYFDFMYPDPEGGTGRGTGRRHGFFNKMSKRVTQPG